ncbi:flagellar biosynthesis anti-sigma factor FlgM [Clostridioides mangenotii]|uniref:flagellar biosynthesis anti-sigma factor FlgM n=1 Tax=Metaclostridioides mangenotii TaxID=1540 RepID=UPI0021499C8A|nr:flagellar biosynthesis anti-sigma factor FlgM [Clostridioides mangenotii]MCR1953981.1 flagellar biosynthesis anti-sigma factor FlgM [Clostridioides mangenotii]
MDIKKINYDIVVNDYKKNIKTIYNSKEVTSIAGVDKIELSTMAREIFTNDEMNTFIDVNKVERIMAAVDNGTYIIDPNKIAKKMLGIMKG